MLKVEATLSTSQHNWLCRVVAAVCSAQDVFNCDEIEYVSFLTVISVN